MESKNDRKEKCIAVMLLAAVGDAMGYKNGDWQFQKSGEIIHKQMQQITKNQGPLKLKIDMKWRYSDDTVMHIATAEALIANKKNPSLDAIGRKFAIEYKKCWGYMSGRAPGKTTGKSIKILNADGSNWNKIPFADTACGCGASMRAACIGLVYNSLQKVIQIAIQSGRMTHHNPIGYLGSVVSACFTYFAINGIPPEQWGGRLIKIVLPKAKQYIKAAGREVQLNIGNPWNYFEKAWKQYLIKRNLSEDYEKSTEAKFPKIYGIMQREHFYKQVSYHGWGGSSGHDSVIIAYDAILGAKNNWQQLCLRAMLHGGDNDSTGTIAGAWYGALYGLKGVPVPHYNEVQDNKKLIFLGQKLYHLYNQ